MKTLKEDFLPHDYFKSSLIFSGDAPLTNGRVNILREYSSGSAKDLLLRVEMILLEPQAHHNNAKFANRKDDFAG